jgi:hypothetical protein
MSWQGEGPLKSVTHRRHASRGASMRLNNAYSCQTKSPTGVSAIGRME